MAEYDDHIALRKQPDGYHGELIRGWSVGGGINGGFLLGIIGNAVRTELGKPDPIVVSASYLSASAPGPCRISIDVRKPGGSLGTVAVELWQGSELRVAALATYGDLNRLAEGGETATTAVEPELPPIAECISNYLAPEEMRAIAPMYERFEMRYHPEQIGWALGRPSGRGVISGWFRFRDDRAPDTLSLLTVLDLLPPVTYDLGRPGWAPTIELTAHVRAVPAPGWLKVRQLTRNVAGGMFEEDCEVWDSAGRLVAQARQLARLPR